MSYGSDQHAVTFLGGPSGTWSVERVASVVGETLPPIERLEIVPGHVAGAWSLRGVTSHARYVDRSEKTRLDAVSPALDRPEATRAALIPIRKSARWWSLPQDERRAIFEERSRHITDSLPALPRVARRLYHSRDLGEPFDFLTWFEYAPEHAESFEALVDLLRSREEWAYVEREVDIRLSRFRQTA
jgi:chlorite dismutase